VLKQDVPGHKDNAERDVLKMMVGCAEQWASHQKSHEKGTEK